MWIWNSKVFFFCLGLVLALACNVCYKFNGFRYCALGVGGVDFFVERRLPIYRLVMLKCSYFAETWHTLCYLFEKYSFVLLLAFNTVQSDGLTHPANYPNCASELLDNFLV